VTVAGLAQNTPEPDRRLDLGDAPSEVHSLKQLMRTTGISAAETAARDDQQLAKARHEVQPGRWAMRRARRVAGRRGSEVSPDK